METLRRTLTASTHVEDSRKGIVTYVASTQDIDSYHEVIRADGWRFTGFSRNAPFVDSHDYSSVEKLLGRVIDFKVKGGKLIETVKWAVEVEENKLAQLGWRMTEAGFLKAVSVGFYPVRWVRPGDSEFPKQMKELGISSSADVRTIYLEQEQIELSACIIGANGSALANARSAGVLTYDEFDFLSRRGTRTDRAVANALSVLRAPRRRLDPVEQMLRTLRKHL